MSEEMSRTFATDRAARWSVKYDEVVHSAMSRCLEQCHAYQVWPAGGEAEGGGGKSEHVC